MNIGQIKFVSWTSAGLLTLGLSYYVWDFVSHLQERNQAPDPKKVRRLTWQCSQPLIGILFING